MAVEYCLWTKHVGQNLWSVLLSVTNRRWFIPSQPTVIRLDRPQPPVSYCRDGWTSTEGETNHVCMRVYQLLFLIETYFRALMFRWKCCCFFNIINKNGRGLTWESFSCTQCPSTARLSRGHTAQMAVSSIRDSRSTTWDRLACSAWGRGAEGRGMTGGHDGNVESEDWGNKEKRIGQGGKTKGKSVWEVNKAAGTYWLFPSISTELLRCYRFRSFNSQSNRAHLLGNTQPIDAHSLHLIKISFKHFLRGRLKSWNTHNFIRLFFRTRRMGFGSQSKKTVVCGEWIKPHNALGPQDFGRHGAERISEHLEVIVGESLSPADATKGFQL